MPNQAPGQQPQEPEELRSLTRSGLLDTFLQGLSFGTSDELLATARSIPALWNDNPDHQSLTPGASMRFTPLTATTDG